MTDPREALIERIKALRRVEVKGTVIDHQHGYVNECRMHVELDAVLRLIADDGQCSG